MTKLEVHHDCGDGYLILFFFSGTFEISNRFSVMEGGGVDMNIHLC